MWSASKKQRVKSLIDYMLSSLHEGWITDLFTLPFNALAEVSKLNIPPPRPEVKKHTICIVHRLQRISFQAFFYGSTHKNMAYYKISYFWKQIRKGLFTIISNKSDDWDTNINKEKTSHIDPTQFSWMDWRVYCRDSVCVLMENHSHIAGLAI